MPFELIVDVVRMVVGLVVIEFSRVEFSGCCICRGNAAEISVEFNVRLKLDA